MSTVLPDEEEQLQMLDESVGRQIQFFLDDWHYNMITSLSTSWTRPKATAAALDLIEIQGKVPFEAGEKEAFVQMEESIMVPKILAKMPLAFKQNFETFILQMQIIVKKASEVRQAVEASPDAIQVVMDSPDESGIVSNVLKKSIVEAGKQVTAIRNRHKSWTTNTESRMARLIRSADDAAQVQQQLNQIEMQLKGFGSQQNEKSKKMMASVGANNDKALIQICVSNWRSFTVAHKGEKEIRDMFEKEIENLDTKLMEYRQAALNNVRNVLMRKAAEGDNALYQQVWKAWSDEVQETKREAGSQENFKAMEAKLAAQSAAQAENTKKVMTRMTAGSDTSLLTLVFSSWIQWLADYKKNKDVEDAVKEQEKKMQEYLARKKDEAKAVLDRMNSSTDSGLVEHVISSWVQNFIEEKDSAKMELMMAENEAKFGALNGRQKDNAKGVMGRVNEESDLNVLLRAFSYWACDAKVERIMRYYNSKMESKKAQLGSVQHLFRSFAAQLDQGLKSDDSARDSGSRRRQGDGPYLPDIHTKK